MYIDPFIAGIFATLGVECFIIVALAVYMYIKREEN